MTTVHVSPRSDLRGARTVARHHDLWLENARANGRRGRLLDLSLLWLDDEGPETISVAAGPSLHDDLLELRRLRPGRELCAVDASLKFLVDEGIEPDYVVITDASEKILTMLEGLPPLPRTKLVANVIVSPCVIDAWRGGDIHWFVMANHYFSMGEQKLLQDVHSMATRIGTKLVPGGNVSSTVLSFLLSVRNSRRVHLFGHDFCWRTDMYAGGGMKDLEAERMASEAAAGTIYRTTDSAGREVFTNGSLERYAAWHKDAAVRAQGRVVNHSSSTILRLG